MDKENIPILHCSALTACYGKDSPLPVLKEIDIEVRKGEVVGLLGPNGFGKTSYFNAIMGRLHILKGKVWFDGDDISRLDTEQIVRRGVRLFPQGGRVFSELSVRENLQVSSSCAPHGYSIDINEAFEWFPDLRLRHQTRAGLLSGGQRQMLSLGMVLLHMQVNRPSVFLLDEPSGSLDPENRNRLVEILQEGQARYGATILMAEENAVFANIVCERFYQFVEPGQLQPYEKANEIT